jgi:hypothetical protein
MTTVLPIPSGPTNREIIDRAYRSMGVSDAMFGRTPEEYAVGVEILSSMMLESPFDRLGYVQQDGGEGNRVEEESGIDRKWLEAVGLMLAERLAPVIGKALAPHTLKAKGRAYSALCAEVMTVPFAKYADGTPRGAGARYRTVGGQTFFPQESGAGSTPEPVVIDTNPFDNLPPLP